MAQEEIHLHSLERGEGWDPSRKQRRCALSKGRAGCALESVTPLRRSSPELKNKEERSLLVCRSRTGCCRLGDAMRGASAWPPESPSTDCWGAFVSWTPGSRRWLCPGRDPLGADGRGLPAGQGAGTAPQLGRANPQAGDGDPHPEVPGTPGIPVEFIPHRGAEMAPPWPFVHRPPASAPTARETGKIHPQPRWVLFCNGQGLTLTKSPSQPCWCRYPVTRGCPGRWLMHGWSTIYSPRLFTCHSATAFLRVSEIAGVTLRVGHGQRCNDNRDAAGGKRGRAPRSRTPQPAPSCPDATFIPSPFFCDSLSNNCHIPALPPPSPALPQGLSFHPSLWAAPPGNIFHEEEGISGTLLLRDYVTKHVCVGAAARGLLHTGGRIAPARGSPASGVVWGHRPPRSPSPRAVLAAGQPRAQPRTHGAGDRGVPAQHQCGVTPGTWDAGRASLGAWGRRGLSLAQCCEGCCHCPAVWGRNSKCRCSRPEAELLWVRGFPHSSRWSRGSSPSRAGSRQPPPAPAGPALTSLRSRPYLHEVSATYKELTPRLEAWR